MKSFQRARAETALQALSQTLGLPEDQVANLGDANNDEMLRFAGYSVAMGNMAMLLSKEIADFITLANEDVANTYSQVLKLRRMIMKYQICWTVLLPM